MNGKKARSARKAAAATAPRRNRGRAAPAPWHRSWKGGGIALAVIALIAASFVLPDALDPRPANTTRTAMGVEPGAGLPAGAPVPAFTEHDVQTGATITATSVYRGKALLFFSEGVMCQACFEQIKGLEEVGSELDSRGIRLISITPDTPVDLRQAVSQYGITTPMISDDDRDMSEAFNTLGKGMHGDTPGHAFVLVSRGKVIWYRDYWLPPTRSMYIKPATLLADMSARSQSS